jgi:hypothetical protein
MRIVGTDVPNMGTGAAASLVRFHHHHLLTSSSSASLRSDGQSSAPGRDSGTTFASRPCENLFWIGKHHRILHCNFVFFRFREFFWFVSFCFVILLLTTSTDRCYSLLLLLS